jgi:thiol-disulfide isomerase/thioredoxin
MHVPPIVVINLPHRTDRLNEFYSNWCSYCQAIYVLEAVSATKLLQAASKEWTSKELAQYATFLSHRKAISFFLKSSYDKVWIAEDDAYPLFDKTFFESTTYKLLLNTEGLVNLAPNLSRPDLRHKNFFVVNRSIDLPFPPHCMHLYQISRAMAEEYFRILTLLVATREKLVYDIDIYGNSRIRGFMSFAGLTLAGQRAGLSDIEHCVVDYSKQLDCGTLSIQSLPN